MAWWLVSRIVSRTVIAPIEQVLVLLDVSAVVIAPIGMFSSIHMFRADFSSSRGARVL
jgi:hypothetical protein